MIFDMARTKLLQLFLLLQVVLFCYANGDFNSTNDGGDKTFDLLSKGDKFIQLDNYYDLILLLGNTGTGKSTLVKFVTGAPLVAVRREKSRDITFTDGGESIGNNTVVSKTFLPEVHVDPTTNQVLVDLAGFNGMRNQSIEIACAYYLDKILNQASSMKLVLTTTHSSVRSGNERHLMIDLLKNVAKMIKNVTMFQDAIALVVTKVDNEFGISYEEEVEYVREYLLECKEGLVYELSQGVSDLDASYIKKSILLLDIFIDQRVTNNIGLFRRPNKLGPISESQLLQDNMKQLQKLLFEDLMFVNTSKEDFEHSLTSKSYHFVETKLLKLIEMKVAFVIKSVNHQLEASVFSEGYKDSDHAQYFVSLNETYADLFDKVSKINSEYDLISYIHTAVQYTNTTVNTEFDINEIEGLITQSIFLRSIVNYTGNEYVLSLKNNGMKILNEILSVQCLYSIILQIHDAFLLYSSHIERFAKEHISFETVTNENIDNTLLKLSHFSFINSIDVENLLDLEVKMKSFVINDLNDIIDYYFRDDVTLSCENDTLFIKSNFILLSRLTDQHFGACKFNEKDISIFALNTVFIDTDLIIIARNISIIGIHWQVMRKSTILVSGFNAKSHSSNRAIDQLHGRPGFPGGPGPNFMGIAENIENSKKLTVWNKGGDGSDGQHGKNGIDGIDAILPQTADNIFAKDIHKLEEMLIRAGYKYQFSSVPDQLQFSNPLTSSFHLKIYNTSQHWKPIGGGDGGMSGLGGISGDIFVGALNFVDVEVNITHSRGNRGALGRGGLGGVGRYNTAIKYYICRKVIKFEYLIFFTVDKVHCSMYNEEYLKADDAPGGLEGNNFEGEIFPAHARQLLLKPQIKLYIDFFTSRSNLFIFKNESETFLHDLSVI